MFVKFIEERFNIIKHKNAMERAERMLFSNEYDKLYNEKSDAIKQAEDELAKAKEAYEEQDHTVDATTAEDTAAQ